MLQKMYWTVLALDGMAALVLWRSFESGPHGQFDGLVMAALLTLLVVISIPAGPFPLLRSNGWRIATFVALLLPSTPLLLWTAAGAV